MANASVDRRACLHYTTVVTAKMIARQDVPMAPMLKDASELLEVAIQELDYQHGSLFDATNAPTPTVTDEWLNKGEWLSLANKVGAEKVFFVDENPVIVFAKHDASTPEELRRFFNRIWCMSRPRLLFLATPGELNVIDLSEPPVKPDENVIASDRIRGTARTAAEVQSKLSRFCREQIESGKLFEDERFEKPSSRADAALIHDLRAVRSQLIVDLDQGYAHALIGRSIFVRYLEDRCILTYDYFESVARDHAEWLRVLNAPPTLSYIDEDMGALLYPRVLANKEFTYALFKQLARDFNGDMFPSDPSEELAVTQDHLTRLQCFLNGSVDDQLKLFFYAYRFDVIPIELISNIYEEFYNTENGDNNQGSHYTPSALVEFLLSQVMTTDRLKDNPRIVDPACGSGIFLVEAFRRIVRYHVGRQLGGCLNQTQLREILRNQITGIDINPEAVRVAAFSLYLALLNYQEPPDIRQNPRLPNLVYAHRECRDCDQHFDVLLTANAFDIDNAITKSDSCACFSSESADIVIGNPPWGSPKKDDTSGLLALQKAHRWCEAHEYVTGDKELSQMFIFKAMDFLKHGGCAGLLVSTGVFFKEHENSQKFRKQWLKNSRLINVTNFAHVRGIFFSGREKGGDAIAPFASAVFEKSDGWDDGYRFEYWSAKKTAMAARLHSVVLSRADIRLVSQRKAYDYDDVWKIFWWGAHHDEALIRDIQLNPSVKQITVRGCRLYHSEGYGFERSETAKQVAAEWLLNYKELPLSEFRRYGEVKTSQLRSVPNTVYRRGTRDIYEGTRLLFKRGVGQIPIVARLESVPFCFTHSIFGVRLDDSLVDESKVMLAIYWSSLAKYYFWMTSGSWGLWHDALHKNAILELPVRLPDDKSLQDRIISIVDDLATVDETQDLFNHSYIDQKQCELDEAIFELYQLNDSERDLILDACNVGLDLFYRHSKSDAVNSVQANRPAVNYGTLSDIPTKYRGQQGLEGYLHAFLSSWNSHLEPDGEFRWRIITPRHGIPMLAVIFSSQLKDNPLPKPDRTDEEEWHSILSMLDKDSLHECGSKRIFIDGLTRIVSETDIVIIKRNERRLWTRSAAREDAESTLLQAIHRQEYNVEST